MYCWRTQFNVWLDVEEGLVLAVGAGAMGVKLGLPLNIGGHWQERGEFGLGEEPDADQIESANSMIWRGLIVWLAIAFLLMVAGWAA
jgi:adenosylcobinamide-phosphate synthase